MPASLPVGWYAPLRRQTRSRAEAADLVDANLFAWFDYLRRWPRLFVHDTPELLWFASDVAYPQFNGVRRARFHDDTVDEQIDETLGQFAARGVPLMWLVGPSTQPYDLGSRLERRGLRLDESLTGMALDLGQLDATGAPSAPGLTIEQVTDLAALDCWLDAYAAGFEAPACARAGFRCRFKSMGFGPAHPLRLYLASMDGRPVATTSLFLGAGVAGIYDVSTVPEARGKGIAAAVVRAALRDARSEGYVLGALQSTEIGVGLYRKLGFEPVCPMALYVSGT